MLVYLGDGTRCYGRRPVAAYRRANWEFQAVLKGKIALRLSNGIMAPQARRLWVLPPDCSHGWGGDENSIAEVVVFHFPHVPEPLRLYLREREFLELPLSTVQCLRLRHLGRTARDYWNHPGPGMPLCHEQILLELSLLVLEFERSSQRASIKPPSAPIDRGLRWYSRRMESDPGLSEVAQAAGVSPAHLRRLFHRTFRMSPKAFFDQLRFQRAMQLMADPAQKLESISVQCGFGSLSAFSRAFKNKLGCSPAAWRTRV